MTEPKTCPFGRDFYNDYDYESPELAENFREVVNDLQENCPVARSEIGEGYWAVTKYNDVRTVTSDPETFISRDGFLPNRPEGMPFWAPIESDAPVHTALRDLLAPFFGPKAVAALEPDMNRHANELIDSFADKKEIDVLNDFALLYPGLTFCEALIGVPTKDIPWLHERFHAGMLGPREERGIRLKEVGDYMGAYLRKRQQEPSRGDVIDALLEFNTPGWGEGPDGFYDRQGTLAMLAHGGIPTVGSAFTAAIAYLVETPKDKQDLIEDRSLLPRAVDELTRCFAPAAQAGRRCVRDTELGGRTIKAGDFVTVGFAAGSLDAEVIPDPQKVDIRRMPNPHMGFGTGAHRCLGSHLARAQMRVALDVWLDRIPEFEFPEGFKPKWEISSNRSIVELPLVLKGVGPRTDRAGTA